MAKQKLGWSGIILSVIGIVLVIVGIVWMTVIFPALAQIPTDYERTYYSDGTFSVLNSETQSMDTFPVEQALAQKAVGTQDGTLLIHEKSTVVNSATGTDLSAYYGDESTLAITRKTLKFAPSIDERGRTGYWAPPMGLSPESSFAIYIDSVNEPLPASYVKSEVFQGLKVDVFQISASDVSLGTNPQNGLAMYSSTTVNLAIEPKTGTPVDQTALVTTSMDMGGTKVPVLVANLGWTDATVTDMVKVAKDAVGMLFWFQTMLPWLLVGIGAVLLILGVILIARKREAEVNRRHEAPIVKRHGATA
jgi:uncharacterized membrane protein